MTKPKLAYFGVKYFPSKGGVSRTTENLIRNLKDKYNITIYCYKHPDAKNNIAGVNVVQFPELPFGGLGVFIYFWLCYLHMIFKGDYDIIHLRKIDSAFFLPLLRLKYKKILATSHESPYSRDKWGFFEKQYFKFNERVFMKSKAKLTSISSPLCKYYNQKYNRDVEYIPNGIEILEEYDFKTVNELMVQYNINMKYLFFAARRIMSTKGCHTMIEAIKKLRIDNPVIIAGETHSKDYMNELINESKGLNVKFIGYISDKKVLLALAKQAEYFIFPSETEGMSIILLEVAGTGTPIICSDIPENTSVFNETEVLFFKNKESDDLAEKLKWAFGNRIAMEEKASRAYKKVKEVYSGDNMTRNYSRLYDELLADRN